MRAARHHRGRPAHRRTSRLVRLLALSVVLLLGIAGAARAHAVVTGSEPPDGAVLDRPPDQIVIRFSEPVSLARAQVLGPSGEDVLAPGAGEGGEEVRLALPRALGPGTYVASYRVVSSDGHPIAGSLVFSLGRVSGVGPTPGGAEAAGWRWAFVAARTILYLGFLGAAGGVVFDLLAKPGAGSRGSSRRIVAGSALLGLAAAVAVLGAQGGLLLGGDVGALLDPATWPAGLASSVGRAVGVAVLGLVAILAGSRPHGRQGARALRVAGSLLVLGSFALSGHVLTAGPPVLTAPPLLLHVAVTALWAGSLLPLHRALGASVEETGPLLGRFSQLAIRAVPVLILAGLVLAAVQVRRPDALLSTPYGRLFLLKMGLAAALLGLAALNRFRLTPALVRGEAGAARRLGRSILAEVGLVALIFAVTAGLGTTPPPRALLAQGADAASDLRARHGHAPAAQGLRVAFEGQDVAALLVLEPGQVGLNRGRLTLSDGEGAPLEALEVTARLSNPDLGIAPLERRALREGSGRWRFDDLAFGMPGVWTVELDLLVSDFERRTLASRVRLDRSDAGPEAGMGEP